MTQQLATNMPDTDTNLPKPARYFPIRNGRYDVKAGLSVFPTAFGNALQDEQLFQFDTDFHRCRDNKIAVRKQDLNEYVCMTDDSNISIHHVNRFILEQLINQHSQYFRHTKDEDHLKLECSLSGNEILTHHDQTLISSAYPYNPPAMNLFDALALELQEDLCVMQVTSETTRLCAAHLCAANHWAAIDKLGMDMPGLHEPIPGFYEQNRSPDSLLQGIMKKQHAYIRFAWGISDDYRFNRHPRLQENNDSKVHGDGVFMRIERQLLWPMPDMQTMLFTIKTLFRDCREMKHQQAHEFDQLVNAIKSMDNAALAYKGIEREQTLHRLSAL